MALSDPLGVVVVGAGYFSQFHLDAWSRIDGVRILAVVDRDLAKAEAAACAHHVPSFGDDLAAMLERVRPDLVDIATPPSSHADLVSLAASMGIDVVCQKPVAPSFDEAVAIVEQAEASNIRLIIHENFRFQPWYREIKGLIDGGRIGAVLGANFRLRPGDGRGMDAYLARQPYFQTMDRFLVHETLVHLIDVFRYLFGEVVAVTGRLRRLNPAIAGEDCGIVILEHAAGFESVIDGNRLSSHGGRNPRLTMGDLVIDGMDGVLRMDGDALIDHRAHDGGPVVHDYDWQDQHFGGDCVHALCCHVVDHLRNGSMVENLGRNYLRNMAIVDAVYLSHETGWRIALDDDGSINFPDSPG